MARLTHTRALPHTRHILQWLIFLIGLANFLGAQDHALRLKVVDHQTDEALPFVTLRIDPGKILAQTDAEGQARIDLPLPGVYTIRATFTGYAPFEQELSIRGEVEGELRLEPNAERLETVTVSDRSAREALRRPVMGVEQLSASELESLPAVLGERDLLRSLQLKAGVSSAGEASNGISVRGGTIDQNLLLYDGAPVFGPTHLFGLFTVFTPEALGGADLYRGNIPARFGGRVTSVLDVRSRTPNTERTEIRGGLGLVSSNLAFEGPLDQAGKLGLLVAARGAFNDFAFALIQRLRDTRSRFADATLRLQYRPSERDFINLTGFFSQDFYEVDLLSQVAGIPAVSNQYAYRTLNGGVEYTRLLNDRYTATVAVHRATYDPELRFPQSDGNNRIDFTNAVRSTRVRAQIDREVLNGHRLGGGLSLERYRLEPGRLDPGGVPGIQALTLPEERGEEVAAYAEDEWTATDALTLSLGLRYVRYRQPGPGEQRLYRPDEPPRRATLEEVRTVDGGAALATYDGLEPRAGLNLRLSDLTSLKASYARSRQYLQNIYNATTPVPTSRWKVSDNNVVPQTGDLYSVGLTQTTGREDYLLRLEAYYRQIHDLLEYRPGADFFLNPTVETDLVRGQGRGYGVELSISRLLGRLTGELNYAYARSFNRVEGDSPGTRINRGDWYPGYFDQPHTFVGNLVLDRGSRHELGLNLVVQSNRPYTVPNGFVTVRDVPIPLFRERNNDRMPTYHRLDFSWTIRNPSREQRRWTGEWVFTVYNVYGRDNAYNIFYQARDLDQPTIALFARSPLAAYKLTIFGAPILSLTYKFNFLP